MDLDGWRARLSQSPEIFPLAIDPATDAVELRILPRLEYEKASFLDARLSVPVAGRVALAELAEAAAGLPLGGDYIFHVGHVGSTLLSRLLGVHPGVFGLREPQALRTLAQADGPWSPADVDRRLEVFSRLYARTWAPDERVILKATSLVSELATRMLAINGAARAILMTTDPEIYVATILGGPNSRVELAAAAPSRLARLHQRLGGAVWRTEAMSEGELAAMSWVAEMAALSGAARSRPGQTLWVDFEAFLAAPEAELARILTFLELPAGQGPVEGILRSGYLERYSKAPEYAYGPKLRREVLDASRREHAGELDRARRWLEAARASWPAALDWAGRNGVA